MHVKPGSNEIAIDPPPSSGPVRLPNGHTVPNPAYQLFIRSATFCEVPPLNGRPGYLSLQSSNTNAYVRHQNFLLSAQGIQASDLFAADTSFLMSERLPFTCPSGVAVKSITLAVTIASGDSGFNKDSDTEFIAAVTHPNGLNEAFFQRPNDPLNKIEWLPGKTYILNLALINQCLNLQGTKLLLQANPGTVFGLPGHDLITISKWKLTVTYKNLQQQSCSYEGGNFGVVVSGGFSGNVARPLFPLCF
jgi:hypothetical protein